MSQDVAMHWKEIFSLRSNVHKKRFDKLDFIIRLSEILTDRNSVLKRRETCLLYLKKQVR